MATQPPLNTWQSGVVWLFNNPAFLEQLREVIGEVALPGRDPSVLVSAFCNYFSLKNPNFGPNYWDFPNTRVKLVVDYAGVYVSGSDDIRCRKLNVRLAKSSGRDLWVRTFLSPFPRST